MNLGILGSTRGTDLEALISAIQQQLLDSTIQIVISNKEDAYILQRAERYNIPCQFVNPVGLSREAFDEQVTVLLRQYQVDLIVLIGYMRILSEQFIHTWRNKVINVHPSLLPAFSGKMDQNVHQAVLESGVIETGCTVHWVTEEVDAGPILIQRKCPVLTTDTALTLKVRVQELEGQALIDAIQLIKNRNDKDE
jgi:phosphoribosylglycinamide formyltransferase-1